MTIAHPMQYQSARAAGVMLACASLFAACRGPTLTIDRPPAWYEDAACYLDGQVVPRPVGRDADKPESRPLPYYGTTTLDAIPKAGDGGLREFRMVPQRTALEVTEPVTPWLFPFDFFLESAVRLLLGADDREIRAALAQNPAPTVSGSTLAGAGDVRRRALQARTAR